jgi:predicted dehydrogenase
MNQRGVDRREFTRLAALAGVGTAVQRGLRGSAADRIAVGFIGVGNRGDQLLDDFLRQDDVDVVAICDLYQPYLDHAAGKIPGKPRQYRDYRRLLEDKEVEAVVISTPDHWHALQFIHSCQAGKDVYVEKPLSLCIAEGRKMIEAVKKYNRVVQVGIQRRSVDFYQEAYEFIRNGGIGTVTVARAFHVLNEWPLGIGNAPDEDPPAGLDWDAWLGPAPFKPYNKNRTLYRFRWFYDYSGGQLTNFGVHYMDSILSALGKPDRVQVAALGGKVAIADNREIPDTLEVIWRLPNGTLVTFSQFNTSAPPASQKSCEVEFRGTKGTLYLFHNGYEVVPDTLATHEVPARSPVDRQYERSWRTGAYAAIQPMKGSGRGETGPHVRNFLDCMRTRQTCNCDIESGHFSTSMTMIGNIALKTESVLEFDTAKERFVNNREADRLLQYSYRAPYIWPASI